VPASGPRSGAFKAIEMRITASDLARLEYRLKEAIDSIEQLQTRLADSDQKLAFTRSINSHRLKVLMRCAVDLNIEIQETLAAIETINGPAFIAPADDEALPKDLPSFGEMLFEANRLKADYLAEREA
jgi:hypothetical protein